MTLYKRLVLVALVGVAYYAGAWFGVTQTITEEGIAVLWPPNAILLAAFLLRPYREWPLIALAALAAEVIADRPAFPLWAAVAFGFVNLFETALAAWLIRRFVSGPFDFNQLRKGACFLLFGPLLASAIAALFGAMVYAMLGRADTSYLALWRVWWFGDALGLLVLTPLIVQLWRHFEQGSRPILTSPRRWEAIGLWLIVAGLGSFVLMQGDAQNTYFAPVLLLPLGIWSAVRLGVLGAAATVALIVMLSTAHLVRGIYPYPGVTPDRAVWLAQEYLAIVAVVAIGLAVLMHEIAQQREALREHERVLREHNMLLEERIAERTAETEQRATQLRALTAELTQTEERERRRLAQSLHDQLQQMLVAAQIRTTTALNKTGDVLATDALARISELLEESIQECRSLTVELSPPVLYDAGLAAGLGWLAGWTEEKHGVKVEVATAEGSDPTDDGVSVLLFQATRELLFNVAKHAQVNRAKVSVDRTDRGEIEVCVADAGRGYDPTTAEAAAREQNRFGLFSIRERLARVGGRMTVRSGPGEGTSTVLAIPDNSGPREAASSKM